MGTITTGIGLISGIDSGSIITQLMALEQAPVTTLQSRIDNGNQQQAAFTDLVTRLASLKLTAQQLQKPQTFQAANTTSSNENVLTATATNGAAVGSYQFQVARLVSTQQSITNGFVDPKTKIGAGTITIEMGGGELNTPTNLSQLNGGNGVVSGQFRVTDRSGASTVIDTTGALTLDDVVSKINNSLNINVHASYDKNGLVLTDRTGKTASDLIVQDIGGGTAAADLGITGDVASNTINGAAIATIGRNTVLNSLNDGRGVGVATAGADFTVTAGDGSTFDVNLYGKNTVGDVLDAINTASGGKVTAAVAANGQGLTLTDAGGGTLSVAADNGSTAAADLGIQSSGTGTLTGRTLIAGPNTTLLSSLKGGAGIPLGKITLQDRNGGSATVDLSGATTVQDVLDSINNAGIGISASLNNAANGIQLQDTSGGTGNIVVSDVNSTTAAALGIAGTFDNTNVTVNGGNLQRQWVTGHTLLSDYNGGKGVALGKFTITNAQGTAATIDLSIGAPKRLQDVINAINGRNIGVTASINANGDGLLITDTTGGPGTLKIEDNGGTTAKDLNILSTSATTTAVDGSFEKTITTDINDDLGTVQQKINALGFGVTASIINDGSGLAPYRLSLNAINSGQDGRINFDAGTTQLAAHTLVAAQDAAVFVGGGSGAQPLLITSQSNQLANVIPGVTVDLQGVSDSPVTLSVTRDSSALADQLNTFTGTFNDMVDKISTLTSFDSTTNKGGLLLGDSTTQSIQSTVYNMLNAVVSGGRYRTLADIGLTIGGDTDGSSAHLVFDQDKFNQAFATDPDAVQNLFTQAQSGVGTSIVNSLTKLIDPVDGSITLENKTLDQRNQQFQDRIDQLNDQLAQKKARLQAQFANMESVLAGLQSQQNALGSLTNLTSSSSSSSKKS
jgi:flagellar hook-associated protein 2